MFDLKNEPAEICYSLESLSVYAGPNATAQEIDKIPAGCVFYISEAKGVAVSEHEPFLRLRWGKVFAAQGVSSGYEMTERDPFEQPGRWVLLKMTIVQQTTPDAEDMLAICEKWSKWKNDPYSFLDYVVNPATKSWVSKCKENYKVALQNWQKTFNDSQSASKASQGVTDSTPPEGPAIPNRDQDDGSSSMGMLIGAVALVAAVLYLRRSK